MKGILLKNRFLLLAIIAMLLAIILRHSSELFNNKSSDFHSFNVNLNQKELMLNSWLDSLENHLAKGKLQHFINNNKSDIDWLFKKYGISIHIFSKTKYFYWTDNSVSLPDTPNKLKNGFNLVENAYIDVQKRDTLGLTIVGLILIKNNFAYENEFLENCFHPSFQLTEPCSIVQDSNITQGAIYCNKGNYVFSLVQESSINTSAQNNLVLFMLFVAILMLLFYGRDAFKNRKFKFWHYIVFSSILIGLRFLFQFGFNLHFLDEFELFNPSHFASSYLFPSLGDLLITTSLASYLIFVFYSKVHVTLTPQTTRISKIRKTVIWFFVFHLYNIGALFIFRHLIEDSAFQFEAFNVLKLSVFSLVGYLILIINFIGYILLIDKASVLFKHIYTFRQFIIIIISLGISFVIAWLIIGNSIDIVSYVSLLIITVFWFYIKYYHKTRLTSLFILAALYSAFSTSYIQRKSFKKRIEETKVIAVNLASEQDPVAEIIIGELIEETKTDSVLNRLLLPENFNNETLIQYLKKKYFEGYLRQYKFTVTICSPTDSLLIEQDEATMDHCFSFFERLVQNEGRGTNIPDLYHLSNSLGYINYLFSTSIDLSNTESVSLFFELIKKPNYEVLGYPELLLEKDADIYNTELLESYAKYAGNDLLSSMGDFPYSLDRSVYPKNNKEYEFFRADGYDHLAYNYNGTNSVIISYPSVSFYNSLISFTYIFFFYLIIVTLLSLIGNHFTHIIDMQLSIKNKITFSMIIILFVSMLIVGGGTIYYTVNQFEKNQNKILSEKTHSILIELEHKLSNCKNINDIDSEYLTSILIKFSNVFYTDINMYDIRGDLVATSRREIFNRNLTSKKINATAHRELVLNKKARIVQKENIGKLKYYSAYVPFVSNNNKLLAYLNLPYFSKEVLLRQELLRVLVAVINIYVFLIILSIIVAIYVSNRLTEPLRMVQQRICNIDIGKKNEHIIYQGKDEIAELVVEYNRMLDELDKSTLLLAKSERETAWREMARQIAHEIKNPLTPMKLSVQLLEKSWKNRDSDFEDRFSKVSQTLIEQIDNLSSIATAFSQFAKMPVANFKKVNLLKPLKHCYGLFNGNENANLIFDAKDGSDVYIFADYDRILQVFTNLIKNAIQAIPKNQKGEIHIIINKTKESAVVEIRDNGVGIPEELENKLFEPNFTTKNSGTGLGLAIVKNIIKEFGGTIWYESKKNKGSSFFVSIPLLND